MPSTVSTLGQTPASPVEDPAAWPTRGTLMSYRSVATRKRRAAERLQARASVLLAEAADFDRRAEAMLAADESR